MTATAVTGTGGGSSGKYTTKELAILANGPSILMAGYVNIEESEMITSPPSPTNTVVLPNPLPGSSDNYIVILTGLNVASPYIGAMDDDEDGNFYRFTIFSSGEGTCMYMITKVGIRPSV